ncbi:putative fumarate hydratase [Leptomonas pyrrhocoris]|uniref:Putative fumarate hydratase n=1 Tax=Leptomonas pyrrhocoris TaxID=157538 RepID=A0A0N0DVM6_LEPPY|nr:hypothetical protein ABB37_04783 [Leptomonas pyrrhocoris]XP_015659025.1 putative fumarate hydratase [Leptomonas pyrrhocoris]KPA80584.1 hypothetical protein ABB37_04783 [Leptomonas pyrrhocoris]KPA80586.1 putative fumarate hydratase [Leptomonas pyrrhocoris]|eukprot:XP_015659023.1 hypothetical protein ABB37_04783 [Leptomonas pyrrhocoris]
MVYAWVRGPSLVFLCAELTVCGCECASRFFSLNGAHDSFVTARCFSLDAFGLFLFPFFFSLASFLFFLMRVCASWRCAGSYSFTSVGITRCRLLCLWVVSVVGCFPSLLFYPSDVRSFPLFPQRDTHIYLHKKTCVARTRQEQENGEKESSALKSRKMRCSER